MSAQQAERPKQVKFGSIRRKSKCFHFFYDRMNIDEIFRKVKNKELTICESCDNIFDYVPQRIYCDECRQARRREKKAGYNRKYRKENREQLNAKKRIYQRKYRKENREKINAKRRKKRNNPQQIWLK